jgi:hypothetical protein
VVLWDLARGTEFAFLPIGDAGPMFEPSGDLITSGSIGVQRWPIQLDAGRGGFHIGPPRRLPLPAKQVDKLVLTNCSLVVQRRKSFPGKELRWRLRV